MLQTEEIVGLIEGRRALLRTRMNKNIEARKERTNDHIGMIAEYTSLEVLLLAIKEDRMDVWEVAPVLVATDLLKMSIGTEVRLFHATLDTWRAVEVTPAVKMGEARRAEYIAEKLEAAGEPELAKRWRHIAAACREDNITFIAHICANLIPQTQGKVR